MRTFREFLRWAEDTGLFSQFPAKSLARKPAVSPYLHDYSGDSGGGGGGAPAAPPPGPAPAAPGGKKMRKKMGK